jgi:hypothetical protein
MTTTAIKPAEMEFQVGERTTCQFGNPHDTDWTEETHTHVAVDIVEKKFCEITKRMYYLVAKCDVPDFVGRATLTRQPRHPEDDVIKGVLYCTNARSFGKGTRGERFG